ncbi:MAG TPA: rRNA maturation RNase YbeY [Vicinamibacterales bacterium]|jgi:probable rRNA maturation factor|nr:rRNA maturation RNase YbeY [Vicinamibacterales bacterium]
MKQGARRQRDLDVTVVVGRADASLARGLAPFLRRAAPAGPPAALTVAIVGDGWMRRMNRAFRGADYATDVLSFPDEEPSPSTRRTAHAAAPASSAPVFLGDLCIARGVARRQAAEHGHAASTEVRLLALHGLLHLLGYDHERDRGEMRRLEERLRRRAGLPTGLTARAARRSARR